jgi:TRAP-type C4-dicarboxylate transport system permease small subunit
MVVPMMDRLLAWDRRLARLLVWIGGSGLLFAAFMVTVDVILRDLFAMTIGGADEISGYIFAVSTAFALPYALLDRVNVRIDALYMHLSDRSRAVLDVISLAALAVFAFPLTWWVFVMVRDSITLWTRSITPLRTPVAIPQSLWLAGLVLFCLSLLLLLVVSAVRLARGDTAGVNRIAGAVGAIEEDGERSPAHLAE